MLAISTEAVSIRYRAPPLCQHRFAFSFPEPCNGVIDLAPVDKARIEVLETADTARAADLPGLPS